MAEVRRLFASAEGSGRAGRRRLAVVGESRYQAALTAIAGGKRRESQVIMTNAVVEREPTNAFDVNAVRVLIAGQTVGYLARAEAAQYGAALDAIGLAALACPAEIRGGWKSGPTDEGHFGVVVWLPSPVQILGK
ncbi:MAG: hypothetical protein IT304_03610 [Dehalococcoidia bacterium]|nr:hypothetical protein [Dehalococcoidia bacterium]